MLMTSTMLALLQNVPLRPNATMMTGTINPDGSAGLVGGVVQKMEGAKKAGIQYFGYPVGIRNHEDMKTGRVVDLNAKGKSLGFAEVRDIRDVYDAYEFMTGQQLQRPAAVSESVGDGFVAQSAYADQGQSAFMEEPLGG